MNQIHMNFHEMMREEGSNILFKFQIQAYLARIRAAF